MANTKISQLTASTTPLAGTEVLAIVQSSTTKQVSVANLTAGRAVSMLSITADTTTLVDDSTNHRVGIGTASPSTILHTVSAVPGLYSQSTSSSSNNFLLSCSNSYNYGVVGTVSGNNTSSGDVYALGYVASSAGGFNPVVQWASTKVVTMPGYGVGTATFSSSGVISSVSDETWKIKDGEPSNPDEMLKKLKPGYWFYNKEKAPIFGVDRQLGFYAQNVNEALGNEAAPAPETFKSIDKDGVETTITKPWGYYDRSVLAVVVMSLKNALETIEQQQNIINKLQADMATIKTS